MSRLSPIGLGSILSYIKSWVIGKIPTKNSELTNDSGYITTSAVPTNYVTSDTDQVVSGVKTTSNYKYIVGPDMTKGTTPTSNRYVTIHRYYDKNMNAVGEYWLRQTATGNTELNFSAKDAFTNGARATTGTDVSSYLSIGVNSSGKSYWEVNGGCRNNLLPLSSNNYSLGSSTLQWNNVYSKEYYINGTVMGDIVTHNSSEYAKSSHTHTSSDITDFPTIPTKTSDLTNDSGFLTSADRLPTGSYIQFAGSQAPEGFLVCNGGEISRTTYSNLFAVIGTTYGGGDGSTTFNLPNLTDRFLQGSTTSGTVKNAGLPNIAGSGVPRVKATAADSGVTLGFDNCSGSLYPMFSNYPTAPLITVAGSYTGPGGIAFNASRSSSIYGSSSTVQPPALTCLICIKY